jgi:peptidoglycan/LPS O-acetylase OafA/YrhL
MPAGTPRRVSRDAAGHIPPSGQRQFRPEIEGLRALAVILVVAFHAGVPRVTGGYIGVDVFYVISGFLITGLLVDELERTGSISLRDFYARRVRRLLPMAMLVLIAVAIGMQFFTPPVFRPTVRFDALSAAFYYSNWQFALESVNYLTLGGAQNPVLHYWSLSVEEQFYIAWPLLLVLAVRLRIRHARCSSVRLRCGLVIGGIGAASLAYSLVETASQPAVAYFETTTRVWEFAAGGALALATPLLRRAPRIAAAPAGAIGLAALAAAAVTDGPTTEFPGTAALVPVAGAALVIAAGVIAGTVGVGALLSLGPLRYIGKISYAWYLWHWPCLVFARTARWAPPDGRIGWIATTVAVAISLALAIVTHALVEVPARRARWFAIDRRRVVLLAGSATAAAVLALAVAGGPLVLPGGDVSLIGEADASSAIPAATTPLDAEGSTAYGAMHGCHVGYGATAPAAHCVFGDEKATRTVILIGDSHAAQWFPALERVAQHERFRLIAWTKSGCPFAPGVHVYLAAIGRDYTECTRWSNSVAVALRSMPRSSLIILGRTSTYLPQVLAADGDQVSARVASRLWGAGIAAGVADLRHVADRVVLLRDTPHAPFDVPACISWDLSRSSRCDFAQTRDGHSDDAEYAAERAAGVPRAAYADPARAVCSAATCDATVDGVITYRDDNHLTAAYASSLWRRFAHVLSVSRPPHSI